MIREAVIAAALACAAVGSAQVAAADPNDNLYFDKPGRYDSDVPFTVSYVVTFQADGTLLIEQQG